MSITIDPNLLLDFFLKYSRFEYALKASGFVIGIGRPLEGGIKRAAPDWNSFSDSIRDTFDRNRVDRLKEAVDYLWNNPPFIEVITTDSEILWEPPLYDQNSFNVRQLLRFVMNIRNNLFHGGKYGNIPDAEVQERTKNLLDAGLVIIEECLRLNHDVKSIYDNAVL